MIRLAMPDIDDDDVAAVVQVLRTGQFIQGPQVAAFERAIAMRCHVSEAVAVNSCTSALHLALLAAGVQAGDAVAVPAYSWPATANVVELCGARPLFIDITTDTWTMDPAQLRDRLHREGRVRVILPVHTFGGMADMQALNAIAADEGSTVIEDAACALGASLATRAAGAWGSLGCFSFHPRKAVTTGEGGAVVGNDIAQLQAVRRLRNHGLAPGAPPNFVQPGFNLRLTEFQAALGSAQLQKLDRLIASRVAQAARYDVLLHAVPVTRPVAFAESEHVFQSYVILVGADALPRRDAIIVRMRDAGVEVQIGTHHIPGLAYFREKYADQLNSCPVGADIAARAIALPLHSRLTSEDQLRVVDALSTALRA